MTRRHVLVTILSVVTGCTETPATLPDPVEEPEHGVFAIDLGPITSDVPFTMTIPENAIGFQLVAEVDGSAGTEQIGIADLTSPSGEVVVDEFFTIGAHVPAATEFGIAVVSVPQTSATATKPVEAGEWTAVVSITGTYAAHAKVFVRTTEDGQFHGGALDVRIYIPDGLIVAEPSAHAITAATAATDPGITTRIDSFFTTLKQLFDLDRGNVELVPLPADFAQITDLAKRDQAMMMTGTSGPDPVVHFILVNDLTLFNGNKSWGLSTGLPGNATTTGHPMAGVFVDISLGSPAVADGMTMVHEMGHFLGLYHTTEISRTYHDPLTDTPECLAGASVCPDGRNIMFAAFWGASGGMGLTASEQQKRVVWGSPLYRQAQ